MNKNTFIDYLINNLTIVVIALNLLIFGLFAYKIFA